MSTGATQSSSAAPESGTVTNQVLQVTFSPGGSIRPYRSIVDAEGACPRDEPLRIDETQSLGDRRHLLPLSIRYVASAGQGRKPIWVGDGELRRAVWRAVSHKMKELGLQSAMPTVTLYRDPLDDIKRQGCLDVVFESPVVWDKMVNLILDIKLEKQGESAWTMSRSVYNNSLSGEILPFDVLNLPMDASSSKLTFDSFNDMAASVGKVVGVGYVRVTGPDFGFPYPSHDAVRGYIRLSSLSMTLSQQSLIELLPTHFKWRGHPYTMMYPGRDLHQALKHSANYPVEDPAGSASGQDRLSSSSSNTSLTSAGQASQASTASN